MNSLGNKIRARRIELGLNQVELAKRAGLSQPTLANLEAGNNERSKFLPEIARELGLTLDQLLSKDPQSPQDETSVAWPFSTPYREVAALPGPVLEGIDRYLAYEVAQEKANKYGSKKKESTLDKVTVGLIQVDQTRRTSGED